MASSILSSAFNTDNVSDVRHANLNNYRVSSVNLENGKSFLSAITEVMNTQNQVAEEGDLSSKEQFDSEYARSMEAQAYENVHKFDALNKTVDTRGFAMLNAGINVSNFSALSNLSNSFMQAKQMINAINAVRA